MGLRVKLVICKIVTNYEHIRPAMAPYIRPAIAVGSTQKSHSAADIHKLVEAVGFATNISIHIPFQFALAPQPPARATNASRASANSITISKTELLLLTA